MTTDVVFAYPYISGRLESSIYGLLWLAGYLREKGYMVGYLGETMADSNLEIAHQALAMKPRYHNDLGFKRGLNLCTLYLDRSAYLDQEDCISFLESEGLL